MDFTQNASTIPDYSGSASDVANFLGLPQDPVSTDPPAGFESAAMADAIMTPPITGGNSSFWDTIKNDASSAVSIVETGAKNAYGGIKDVTKTVYGDLSSGVGTVVDDVTRPVANAEKTVYWYLIGGVVVLLGGIYFIGKTGAFKVNAVV